ncbi:MAG: transposase family protein [bacterium]|nr:transposase family protein [bacterium]
MFLIDLVCKASVGAAWPRVILSVAWQAMQTPTRLILAICAFPFDEAPRYFLRDRDGIFGDDFRQRVANMGIEEVIIAPRSPWQNPYAERIIGTLRRELFDHVIVLNEAHLRRLITPYLEYYHTVRPHLSLDRNAPMPRPIQASGEGKVVAMPYVGCLHCGYRRAA